MICDFFSDIVIQRVISKESLKPYNDLERLKLHNDHVCVTIKLKTIGAIVIRCIFCRVWRNNL